MTYEHAPWRRKGAFTGIVQAGFPVGLLLANLVFLVSVHLPGDWAWRVPFLVSIVLVIVGLIIRSKVPESPVRAVTRTTYDGRALAIIRPIGPGSITVRVTAAGLDAQQLDLLAR